MSGRAGILAKEENSVTQGESPFRVLPGGTNSDYKGFVRNQFPTECRKLNLALGHL